MLGDRMRAERVYKRRRSTTSSRRRSRSCSAATITARRCATPRRWSRSPAKPAARGRPSSTPCSASSRRGRTRPTPRRRRTPGWCWPRARMAKDAGGVSLDVDGEQRQGRALSQPQGGRAVAAVQGDQHRRRRRCRPWCRCPARRSRRSRRRSSGFKIERLYYTLDGEAADPTQGQAEPALRRGAARSPSRAPQFGRVLVADYLPAGFEIDNPRLVSSGDTGTLSWIENAKDAGAFGVPRRPLQRGVRAAAEGPAGVRGGLCGARGVARAATCCRRPMSRTCTGRIASAAPAPARSRSWGSKPAMKIRRLILCATRCVVVAAALGGAWWVHSLGPAPRGETLDHSTLVVDRDGRLLRPYATTEGRWRLPATLDEVDPRYVEMLLAYEDRRFRTHRGVDPLAMGARRCSSSATAASCRAARPSPCRWRGCWSRAPSARSAPSCDRWCAPSSSSAVLTKDEMLALYLSACALRRQSRRHARRVARLFRQGADAAFAGRGGAAGRAAAVAGAAPARSLGLGCARRARPRARPHRHGGTYSRRRGRARQARRRCRTAASRCRRWRRMPPTRPSRRRRCAKSIA